jgi:hypothetical protein
VLEGPAVIGELRELSVYSWNAALSGVSTSSPPEAVINYGVANSTVAQTTDLWAYFEWTGGPNVVGIALNELGDYIAYYNVTSSQYWLSGLSSGAAGTSITIYNPNNFDLTNYQVRIMLPQILRDKAIKVIGPGGQSLPFCYETATGECTTDYAKGDGYIWVKVPYLPAGQNVTLSIVAGSNGAVPGDQVFLFYEDFDSYANGAFNTNSKWTVNRYKGDTSTECVIENGVLWLVTKSMRRGCNIVARNFYVKSTDKVTVEMRFLVDYSYGAYTNDGDGLTLIVDGNDTTPWCCCSKGVSRIQGVAADIYTDDRTGNGWISVGPHTLTCVPQAPANLISYASVGLKTANLNDGIISLSLNGTAAILKYTDLNASDGYVTLKLVRKIDWNVDGKGYLMIGAGTGCASLNGVCQYDDSGHGVDWIRVRKYAPQEPIVYYSTNKDYVLVAAYMGGSTIDGLVTLTPNNPAICAGSAPCLTIVGIYKPNWNIVLLGPFYLSG